MDASDLIKTLRKILARRPSTYGLCTPLPTLHPCPREQTCTARGRCGSLFLHRIGLSPTLLAGLPAHCDKVKLGGPGRRHTDLPTQPLDRRRRRQHDVPPTQFLQHSADQGNGAVGHERSRQQPCCHIQPHYQKPPAPQFCILPNWGASNTTVHEVSNGVFCRRGSVLPHQECQGPRLPPAWPPGGSTN